MFKERVKPTTKADVMQDFVPKVQVSSVALTKMKMYVDNCPDEIGWMGTARKDEQSNIIKIDDVYLFEQDVSGTTTEITPEGLGSFAQELLESGDEGLEVWNNLKMWGHSHVNMGITPSGQDDIQMETFKEGGHDWFIRLIANKKGEMKIDLYDYKNHVILLDLPWSECPSPEEEEIYKAIEELYEMLDKNQEERDGVYKADIEAEMKLKVRKKSYLTTAASRRNSYSKVVSTMSQNRNASNYNSSAQYGMMDDYYGYGYGYASLADAMVSDKEVHDYFTEQDLLDLSHCGDTLVLEDELITYGYANYFTGSDLHRILRVLGKYQGSAK